MKKLLIIAVLALGLTNVQAQKSPSIERIVTKDSAVNTDTALVSYNSIGSNVKSLQVTALKSSGTVSAKVYIRGTVDGIAWVNIDSLTLTDVTTYQVKVISVGHTMYNSYQAYAPTAGTQKYYLWFSYLRRQDEGY